MIDLGIISTDTLGVPTVGRKDSPLALPDSGSFIPN